MIANNNKMKLNKNNMQIKKMIVAMMIFLKKTHFHKKTLKIKIYNKILMIFLMHQITLIYKIKIKQITIMKMLHFNNKIFLKVYKMKNNQIKMILYNNQKKM